MTQLETTNLVGMESVAESIYKIDAKISDLKKEIKALEKKKEASERNIKQMLEDKDIGILKGYVIEYKRNTRKAFNQSRFKEDHPDIFQQYTDEKPMRRLVIKKTQDDEEDFEFDF